MKKIVLFLLVLSALVPMYGQRPDMGVAKKDFSRIEQLLERQRFANAYMVADSLRQVGLKTATAGKADAATSRLLLTATWYMELAAVRYQEDVKDSSLARFRAILPYMTVADRSLCYLFLDKIDSALVDSLALREVPNTQLAPFVTLPDAKRYVNTTPTMYDLVMHLAMERLSPREAVALAGQLVQWYRSKPANKTTTAILLYNELEYARRQVGLPNTPRGRRYAVYQKLLNRYRQTDDDQIAYLYYTLAELNYHDSNYTSALAYCDSAIARFPRSQGGVECAQLRQRIVEPDITLLYTLAVNPAGRDILCRVHSKNADTLYYRLVDASKENGTYTPDDQMRKRLLGRKVLKEWAQPLPSAVDYRPQQHYGYIPAMPSGHYALLVSTTPDFSKRGFVVKFFSVAGAAFVRTLGYAEGYVVDYATGKPIANQKVELQVDKNWSRKFATLATAVTDAQGYYHLDFERADDHYYYYRLKTHYDGLDIFDDRYGTYYDTRDSVVNNSLLFFDRPVYRPGDTLHFLFVESQLRLDWQGKTIAGNKIKVLLRDVNYKYIDSLVGTTDTYGRFDGQFVIPAQALPGTYRLKVFGNGAQIQVGNSDLVMVEAYKQPKFTVTLNAADRLDASGHSVQPSLGDSLAVNGLAASYSQVPVSGAKVVYSVRRSYLRPWWRRYYSSSESQVTVLCADSTVTDAEGHFRIVFLASPDSAMELSTHPCFTYEVSVDVTDLNGETHSKRLALRLGYENSFIDIASAGQRSTWEAVEYQYCDLNGTPLQGEMQLKVERLRQPKTLWLSHEAMQNGLVQTISEAEFRRRFPLTPYSLEETRMEKWPAEKVVLKTRVHCKGLSSNSIPLPQLPAGIYRISMSCGSVSNEAVVVYTPRESDQVQSMDLLWSDLSQTQVRVGDTVTLRLGTRHHGVTAFYQLLCGIKELDRRVLHFDGDMTTLRIPVTEQMLGHFDICLHAVKEGRSVAEQLHVEVLPVHKQIAVEFITFRDKLSPGDKETWTLKLSRKAATPDGRKPVSVGDSAAMLLTMYDASLDTYYGTLSYLWWPWWKLMAPTPLNVYYSYPYYRNHYYSLTIHKPVPSAYKGLNLKSSYFAALDHRGWGWGEDRVVAMVAGTARGESGMVSKRMYKSNNLAAVAEEEWPAVQTDLTIVEDDMEVEEESYAYAEEGLEQKAEEPYIRSNLSTLAFFEPTLRTDANGTVSYSFTVPDLLTQWNVKGLAWTRDLAIGQVERSLVTQKQLMIQPNMPRFLREGDTATLMAKVMNLTDSDMTVTVDFSFEIPATAQRPMQHHADSREVHLPAHGNAMVAFPVTIPVGGTVGTYRFMACASHHSDGEQGPLPLLTNRQAVTTSVSMFMNGQGAKEYTLSLPTSSTAEPVSFTVEYTANPIWMAIQTLPYMAECANPSNVYLFNSFYVNTLGKAIAEQYPELKHCADHASEEDSPLFRNEDVRQTLLSETPWLRDGTSEVERLRQIAKYYDGAALQRQVDDALAKLQMAQRSDGSWSWMPDGRYGSTYVTQYLLKGLGSLSRQRLRTSSGLERRALAYVDKEAYRVYQEWMEYLKKHPGSTFRPIMLDYLYTRSYFSGQALSVTHQKAYDYFYSNARLHYSDYTSLYDQALLALVFQRRGDTRLAREMVTRIKQKALYSDEMGMYWRDNRAGYFYYQRPVETQALLIETFREVMPSDTLSVAQMQQWLLKQKQTTRWNSDIATLRAIQALMPTDRAAKRTFGQIKESDRIIVTGKALSDTLDAPVGRTGYLRHTYRADSLAELSASGSVSATVKRPNKGISWGALFYQYTEQMDKIPASETGIQMTRRLYRVSADGTLAEIVPGGSAKLHVGDRLRIVLTLSCDRNLEYVEMKNFRAACLEPVTTASGWSWSRGFGYYVAVNNSHDAVYIDRLDKGKYTIESTYYVTNPGTFTLAPAVLQCLYAPEFRATSAGTRIEVK